MSVTSPAPILVVGTFDTKAEELYFLRDCLQKNSHQLLMLDVSTSGHEAQCNGFDISAGDIAKSHPKGADFVFTGGRGQSVAAMSVALEKFLPTLDFSGVISLGGSGGTSIIAPAMQALPIGMPKMLVSTMAAGNMAPYVQSSDICVYNPVTDISGLNPILKTVLKNAAYALSGMIKNWTEEDIPFTSAVGMTMFGVTTKCVETVRKNLEKTTDCLVFHATGTGGKTLEKLVSNGLIQSVIDITTTEIADEMAGGILSAGPQRLDVFTKQNIPYVGSCGALDMVNFGALNTVPNCYKDRLFHIHNLNTTLMRTSVDENQHMGRWIGEKLARFMGPIRFLIPLKGFSALDKEGEPFFDPTANEAFISSLEQSVYGVSHVNIEKLPFHINDTAFAEALIVAHRKLTRKKR